jgi:hypothetical protein
MNRITKFLFGTKPRLSGAFAALAMLHFSSQPSAFASSNITNGNSTATFDFGSSAGMTSWTVDALNQVSQQTFFYRIGNSGPQFDLTQISATPTITFSGAGQKTVNALYANSQYGVKLSYTLAGGTAGSGKSGLNETITLYNYAGGNLDFHFFMYGDYVLGGPAQIGSQNVQMGTSAGSSTSVQTFGAPGNNSVVSLSPASHTEVAPANQLYNELTTMNDYTLNDSTSGSTGNATWGWEWDYNVTSSQTLSIIDTLAVPEPSSVALMFLAGGILALRRKRTV